MDDGVTLFRSGTSSPTVLFPFIPAFCKKHRGLRVKSLVLGHLPGIFSSVLLLLVSFTSVFWENSKRYFLQHRFCRQREMKLLILLHTCFPLSPSPSLRASV